MLVSALWWEGKERGVLLATLNPEIELLLTDEIMTEFMAVVSRRKFSGFPRDRISQFIEILLETAVVVEPKTNIDAIGEDPNDKRILECAVEGGANFIVTGDRHLLKLGSYRGIKIVTASEILKFI